MRRLLFVVPLMIFAGAAAWMAVPLIRGDDPSVLPSALIDQPVPAFALPPLPGRERGLGSADLGGEVVLVNYFASWCFPCLAEHPLLMRLAREEGLTIYGIAHKDAPEDTLAWLARNGDPFTRIGVDRDNRVGIDWGVYGIPETFVIDADGRIRYRHVGPLTPDVVATVFLPLIERLRE